VAKTAPAKRVSRASGTSAQPKKAVKKGAPATAKPKAGATP